MTLLSLLRRLDDFSLDIWFVRATSPRLGGGLWSVAKKGTPHFCTHKESHGSFTWHSVRGRNGSGTTMQNSDEGQDGAQLAV